MRKLNRLWVMADSHLRARFMQCTVQVRIPLVSFAASRLARCASAGLA
jgi:hypothetical protein